VPANTVQVELVALGDAWLDAVEKITAEQKPHLLQVRQNPHQKAIWLTYEDEEQYLAVLEDGLVYKDQQIPVILLYVAKPKLWKVYVCRFGLARAAKTANELRKYFSAYGKVLDTCLAINEGVPTGDAFVIIDAAGVEETPDQNNDAPADGSAKVVRPEEAIILGDLT
jgi:hypothetical protein